MAYQKWWMGGQRNGLLQTERRRLGYIEGCPFRGAAPKSNEPLAMTEESKLHIFRRSTSFHRGLV
jgi:hypothetical protein